MSDQHVRVCDFCKATKPLEDHVDDRSWSTIDLVGCNPRPMHACLSCVTNIAVALESAVVKP